MRVKELLAGIKKRDRVALAQAITLVESKNPEHQKLAQELMEQVLPLTGNARRIGISGTPGVGKSTFIENYGMHLINRGETIAVLAVDPTSQITGGSILGDKTRMSQLSAHKNAFIRPSPNGETLGGIAAKTREAMLLCDACGFDSILIETVGVGQSELAVSHLVDCYVLLMQPGSGDEIQGIKRGVLEVADLVIVNKADGDKKKLAEVARHDFTKSVGILHTDKTWQAPVLICSSLEKQGFETIDDKLDDFFKQFNKDQRSQSLEHWIKELLLEKFMQRLHEKVDLAKRVDQIQTGKSALLKETQKIFNEVVGD